MTQTTYQLTYLLDPGLGAQEKEQWQGKISRLIEDREGTVLSHNEVGTRQLSYPIKKKILATYVIAEFSLPGEKASEIARELKHETAVLRTFLTKQEKIRTKPVRKTPPKTEAAAPQSTTFAKEQVEGGLPEMPAKDAAATPTADEEVREEQKSGGATKVTIEDIDKHLEELLK